MKIVDKTAKMTTFETLSVGSVFKYRGIVYVKTLLVFDDNNITLVNAVDLENGNWALFDCKDVVEVLNAELRIKGSGEA